MIYIKELRHFSSLNIKTGMNMIRYLFFLGVSLIGLSSQAQNIVFEYDNAGNRVKRTVILAADLTPFITIAPNVMSGPTTFDTRIRILNLNTSTGSPTTGATITVRVLKSLARWSFVWDEAATINGLGLLNNSNWTYNNESALFHIWTSTDVIAKGHSRYLGFTGLFLPGATTGAIPITVTIDFPSGGEINNLNQSDVEEVTFYPNTL